MKKTLLYTLILILFLPTNFSLRAQKTNSNLKINEGDVATVFQDECVLLDIAIFNKKAQTDKLWNMAGEERIEELNEMLKQGKIKQEDYDKEKNNIEKGRRIISATELGSTTSSWTSAISWKVMNTADKNYIQLPIALMKKPSTEGKAVLDENGRYMACYGIAPGDLKSISPGTYAIECIINNIASNTVILKIEAGMMSTAFAASELVLLRFGQFYWHNENGERTVYYADRLLMKVPVSVEALSLKGDGQVLEQLYQPALDNYKKAAAEYYKQYGTNTEPPEYLLDRITWLKQKLGK